MESQHHMMFSKKSLHWFGFSAHKSKITTMRTGNMFDKLFIVMI